MSSSRVQIVTTLGPASSSKEVIAAMIKNGADVMRLNFSHSSQLQHLKKIKIIREVAQELHKSIPIIQDLSGPRQKTKTGHQRRMGIKNIITAKDIHDLEFGLRNNIDFVVMSFVGEGNDIVELRRIMSQLTYKPKPIIAKIERKKALEHLTSLINAADAIMIGRGDLGNEVPLEEIPFITKKIIDYARIAKKPVITATQMMLSMVKNPYPTRAEVTDVAYAVISGSDAVMLSEETAIGKYPIEVVKMMDKIICASESNQLKKIKVHPLKVSS